MRLALPTALSLALSGAWGCGQDTAETDPGTNPPPPGPTFDQCGGDSPSFVRQAFLSLDGRRPFSQAETDVYVDLYKAAAAQGRDPKDTVVRAIMSRPEFTERWVDVLMDALQVQRVDLQTEASCWDQGARENVGASLAAALRDTPATGPGDGQGVFTMADLARSAIALDDLTPVYRAQLFSLVSHPMEAANVPPLEAELGRRTEFGETFDSAYLHRDIVCLGCHNSQQSVTDSDDPALDRFWPVRGLPEKAVYGDSTGADSNRAHAAFRVDQFVGAGTAVPWGWAPACGTFAASVPDDIAGMDAKLASVTGMRATVFDLEAALGRGFAALRNTGPVIGADGAIADPDTALAWLVTLKITEDVWKQVTGTGLTIANYYPRNRASGELLDKLATRFAQSGFSLKTLLSAVVATDYYNRQPPELGCGDKPYTYPNVFDPWVIADADLQKRQNGPGDAVTAIDARTLIAATNAALVWPPPPAATRFPDYGEAGCETLGCAELQQSCDGDEPVCCTTLHAACEIGGLLPQVELPFERGIGMFLRNSEHGFRGLDFQARLVWEDRFGACARPAWATSDFIDTLTMAAAADPTATAADVIAALKDRLVGEPKIAAGAEHDVLSAMVGGLDGPASGVTGDALRKVCGALLESPQFALQGIAGGGGARPKLTPADASYDAVCTALAARGLGVPGLAVSCAPGALTLVAARTVGPAETPAFGPGFGPAFGQDVPVRRGRARARR